MIPSELRERFGQLELTWARRSRSAGAGAGLREWEGRRASLSRRAIRIGYERTRRRCVPK